MTLESLYQEFVQSAGISTDTRQAVKDTLFFALRGELFDGNAFVPDALRNGCRLAITESEEYEGEARTVVVPSTLDTMQQLAKLHRSKLSLRVLAITGSNGKTTTKELVSAVLSKRYSVLSTAGNLNNHIGVPLTLLTLHHEDVAVIEMGANHPGEIALLSQLAEPELGIITNVGKAHLEGFGSEQGVLNAKGELYDFLAASGGMAILDGRDNKLLRKAAEAGVQTLVISPDGDLKVEGRVLRQSPYLEVELELEGKPFELKTRLVGSYNLQNILFAAGTGLQFQVPAEAIVEAIGHFQPRNQRSQFIEGGLNRVILDAYNANPTSMREAISGLLAYASPPRMLILGDMAELGGATLDEHRALVEWIKGLSISRVLLVGPHFSKVCEPSSTVTVFSGRQNLEDYLQERKPQGYHILVKGSRVMGLEGVIKYLVNQ